MLDFSPNFLFQHFVLSSHIIIHFLPTKTAYIFYFLIAHMSTQEVLYKTLLSYQILG